MISGLTVSHYRRGYLDEAIRILTMRYGESGKLDEVIIKKINRIPVIRKFTTDTLIEVLPVMDEIVSKARDAMPAGHMRYLALQKWIFQGILNKLPKVEQDEYHKQLYYGTPREDNFLTLRDYLANRFHQLLKIESSQNLTDPDGEDSKKSRAAHYHQASAAQTSPRRDDSPDRSDDSWGGPSPPPDGGYPRQQVYAGESRPAQQSTNPEAQRSTQRAATPAAPTQPSGTGATGTPAEARPKRVCPCCKGEHPVWLCQIFIRMEPADKYEFVRANGLCYHCLGKGHGIAKCTYKPEQLCGKDGCRARHHRLVHKPRTETTLCTIEEYMEHYEEEPVITEQDRETAYLCGVSITADRNYRSEELTSEHILLNQKPEGFEQISIKTVTCDLISGDLRKRVVVVIDSGANNTNIDAHFAGEQGLKVLMRGIEREMHQVTSKERLVSNLVTFELCPLGTKGGPHYTIGAFTVPALIEGTPVPDWVRASNRYAYLKHTEPMLPEDDDKCVILLGGDYAGLMTGREQYHGRGINEPIAEKTPLGWAYTGRTGVLGIRDINNKVIGSHQSLVSYQRGVHRASIVKPEDQHRVKVLLNSLRKNYLPDDFCRNAPPIIGNREVKLVIYDPKPEEDPINAEEIVARFREELATADDLLDEDIHSDLEGIESPGGNDRTGVFRRNDSQPEVDQVAPAMIASLQELIKNAEQTISKLRSKKRVRFEDKEAVAEFPVSKDRDAPNTADDERLTCLGSITHEHGEEDPFYTEISLLESQKRRDEELSTLIRHQWEMDSLGLAEKTPRTAGNGEQTPAQWTAAQKEIDDRMKIVYLPDEKKFQMTVPWKDGDKPHFQNNRPAVKQRQDGLVRRLPAERLEKVRTIFQNYLEKDYVRKLESSEIFDLDSRYLPFFCVCDELKETTPVRVVWDCKAVYHGKSLNSEIEETPNRLQDLFKVLLRLRKFQYTITSDVSEMFLRIRLDPKDRPYHRFVFDGADYIWNSILFGNVASPNGSQKAIATACDLFGAEFPEAVETLRNSFYMDDASDSRPTEERALETAKQLLQIMDKITMPIHKFYSNSPLVLKSLDPNLLAKQITLGDGTVEIESGKILGMRYNASPEEDYLAYAGKFTSIREWSNRSKTTKIEEGKWTKRDVARAAASIYDPHGLISPFTARAKVILQEIWKRPELDWDSTLPPEISMPWEQYLEQVFIIPEIKINRWLKFEPKCTYQLHTFCDASEEGLCCAVYLRVKKRKEVDANLIAAKARISPLKAESISRLELAACVMGVRLCHAIQDIYRVKVDECFYWTDSMVSLHWINTPAKAFKAFVAHRIGEIQTHTEPRQWFHVSGKENPADVGTRKISALELKESELWWKGSPFLLLSPTEWPKRTIYPEIVEDKEIKHTSFKLQANARPKLLIIPEERKTRGLNLIHPEHTSVGLQWDGLKQITRRLAYVIRFLRGARRGRRLETLELDPREIDAAKRRLITMTQEVDYYREIEFLKEKQRQGLKTELNAYREMRKSKILAFAPTLDPLGVLRSKSRLEKSEVYGFDKTNPVILDKSSGLARLLVEKAHYRIGHPVGHRAVQARIASKYVISGLGNLVYYIQRKCFICRLKTGKPMNQLEAALPVTRLGQNLRAFADTGMDYAGPFELKMGRAKARKKVWVLVLTCMATRAVHFEPTGGMETTHVINALSRFIDIRGTPVTITSDNQTSFVKANKTLSEWGKIDFKQVIRETQELADEKGIKWNFNPPKAPHFGGVFEIIVKAMKRALEAMLTREDVEEEEFRTVVSKAAWMLNSRPIQRLGNASDLETLTPAHFLGTCPEEATFPPDLPPDRRDLPTRLKQQVEIQQHLWKRFGEEIIPDLAARKKWLYQKDTVKVGDLMVEIDENNPRGQWKKVLIRSIEPSTDGLIRKVVIQDSERRTYLRPITQLVPIRI
jgi:hypothetical protein